ncbi:MAG: HIRAN domain-containing protein [Chiayiivirga sp.]|jgi:hypothetical protein|nr:HIRAN domain-containing protein [Chiayiivirga sp.]
MNFIEHIHEPRRLLLVWQAAEPPRSRRAVAEFLRSDVVGGRTTFRYLTDTTDLEEAKREGFVGFPAFRKLDQTYDLGVVETFMRRLPPSSRGDYGKYLEQFRLRPDVPLSEMALLGYTGAKLPSDGFSILDPLDDITDACDVLIEVAGFRHTSTIPASAIELGSRVTLREENDNPHDANALAVYLGSERIGHIPRPQAPALREFAREPTSKSWSSASTVNPNGPLFTCSPGFGR